MKDYPILGRVAGGWDQEQAERGANLRLCEKELPRFAKWYRTSRFFGTSAVLYAAQIYCLSHNHTPNRFAFIQTLTQVYEQQALSLTREYPPHLTERRWFHLKFRRSAPRAPPAQPIIKAS